MNGKPSTHSEFTAIYLGHDIYAPDYSIILASGTRVKLLATRGDRCHVETPQGRRLTVLSRDLRLPADQDPAG
jgi:hypothetical protein